MREAAGEHAQLLRQRRGDAAERVEAPRRLAAHVGAAREAAQAGVVAGAAVVERGGGDVADAPAGGAQACLPLLLVAAVDEVLVEAPDALERAAAHGDVRAPGARHVVVGRAEVERGDRRPLAAACAEAVVLEARVDRPDERADLRRARLGGADERGQPAGTNLDVVVDEDEQVGGGDVDGRVARRVDPARPAALHVAGAVTRGHGPRGVVGPVVDDDHLGAVLVGLRADRAQRDVEVPRAAAGRDPMAAEMLTDRRRVASPGP